MKWYVIKVVTGKEKKMKETIENELKEKNNENIISTLLVPTQKTIQLRKGKKIQVEKNFFPGYIFVECETINEVESNIKHINGVASVLKQPLTQLEIDRILGNDSKKEIDEKLHLKERVKIIDGPFSSFVGVITELESTKQKAKVSVSIFGRETLIDLNFSQVVKE